MSEIVEIAKVKKLKKEAPLSKNPNLVKESFSEVSKKICPLWDIRDYVAVNPFFGFKDKSFLETVNFLKDLSGKGILPRKSYFLKKYKSGEIIEFDLEVGRKFFEKENSEKDKNSYSLEELISYINTPEKDSTSIKVRSVSDLYDLEHEANKTILITNEVSKWASAYFDEGQALWKVQSKNPGFYAWWRSLAKYDNPFNDKKGRFSKLVKALPLDSQNALEFLTEKLFEKEALTQNELTDYFYRLIYTVLGWSSYIKKFEFEAERSGDKSQIEKIGGLIDIVVIRMAYDVSLLDSVAGDNLRGDSKVEGFEREIELSYIWLNAAERAYRRKVEEKVKKVSIPSEDLELERPDVQMAFCIDVRSEILRRHLEKTSDKIQTIGFAGFFGMPISVRGLGHQGTDQNCPVLLNSGFTIGEKSKGEPSEEKSLIKKKKDYVETQYLKKIVQSSANSGFSFVETMGFAYTGKILTSGFGKIKPNIDVTAAGLKEKEKSLIDLDLSTLSLDIKTNLAFGALKNMGLTKNFAKFVFFFGHGSESSNNPYASALDCGACAGHNGKSNADLLAKLLNDNEVQDELKKKGVEIPSDTVFLSGWHNTVRDELKFDELENLSSNQKAELEKYTMKFDKASENCREERAAKFPNCSSLNSKELKEEMNSRANDWSEIRPEWGLARNASFIVGRRELTRDVDLEGRAFLHDYDSKKDQDLSVLELIMTAPMIVTNWINMQYYASTVDPKKFSAGNKVLNNVVGGIGCIQGNEGDLLGGLTEQSVWYQGEYFHEPLRLQVFIEATTESIDQIIAKHGMVNDLLSNNWMKVISIHPETREFKIFHSNSWVQIKEDIWS